MYKNSRQTISWNGKDYFKQIFLILKHLEIIRVIPSISLQHLVHSHQYDKDGGDFKNADYRRSHRYI